MKWCPQLESNQRPLPYQGRALPLSYVGYDSPQISGRQSQCQLERVVGIEPTLSAWKAEVLPLNYTRLVSSQLYSTMILLILVEGEGFEPSKAEPSDLQSDPFDRSGTPPKDCHFLLCTAKSQEHIRIKSINKLID